MKVTSFKSKPYTIFAFRFLGEECSNFPWLKLCGTKLTKEERVGKFWNSLHDSELEVQYGDWVVCNDMNDLYPIKHEVLYKKYEEQSLASGIIGCLEEALDDRVNKIQEALDGK